MTYRSQDLHLCAGSESASVFWHIISSQQVGKPDHFYLLAAYLQDKKICRNLKIFPDNLDNNTESVRMLNFIFKGWSKVWCLCSSSGQNGCCEARRECIHTHIHGYAVSRLPELWIKSSSSLKRMHIQAELLLWIGSGHTWGPVHVVGCISVQPWGHSLWNSPGIHTATAHSKWYFQPSVFPFCHTISSGWGSSSSRGVLPFLGALSWPTQVAELLWVLWCLSHEAHRTAVASGSVTPAVHALDTTSGLSRASLNQTQATPSFFPWF